MPRPAEPARALRGRDSGTGPSARSVASACAGRSRSVSPTDALPGSRSGCALCASLADWHVLPALEPGLGMPQVSRPHRCVRVLGRSIARPAVAWWPRFRPWICRSGDSGSDRSSQARLRRRTFSSVCLGSGRAEQARIVGVSNLSWREEAGRAAGGRSGAGRRWMRSSMPGSTRTQLFALHALARDLAVRRRIVRWAAEDRRPKRCRIERSRPHGHGPRRALPWGACIGSGPHRPILDGEVANREEAARTGSRSWLAVKAPFALRRHRPRKKSSRKKAARSVVLAGGRVQEEVPRRRRAAAGRGFPAYLSRALPCASGTPHRLLPGRRSPIIPALAIVIRRARGRE